MRPATNYDIAIVFTVMFVLWVPLAINVAIMSERVKRIAEKLGLREEKP